MDKTSAKVLKYGGLAAGLALIGLNFYSMKQYNDLSMSEPFKQEIVLTNEIEDLETRLVYCVPTEIKEVTEDCVDMRKEQDRKNNLLGKLKDSEEYQGKKEDMKEVLDNSSAKLPFFFLAAFTYLIGGVSYERHKRKEKKEEEQKRKIDELKP